MKPTTTPDAGRGPRDPLASWLIPGLVLLFQLATYAGYGYFRDELYYIANGRHLDFGYVEHPPLVALIAALVERTLGTSLFAIRLLPAIAHALTVATTSAIAREMGGGRIAQRLAALATVFAPLLLGLFALFSMNAFDVLFWALLWWVVARWLRTGDDRLWLLFGVVAGIGLENKVSVLFAGFGIVCGLLLAGPRRVFLSRSFWVAGVVAGLLFLPHVAWQMAHGWPTLEFVRNATEQKNVALAPVAFLGAQVVSTLPALPIWLAGLVFLLVGRPARPYRSIGWAFVAVLAVMLSTNAKPYYLVPAYTALFAAGGVALERSGAGPWARAARGVTLAFLVGFGILAAPLSKALLSEDGLVGYAAALGVNPPQEERQQLGRLPQHFADMHGWPELAAAIADVHRRLPPADRVRACVWVQNYGEAGAIDLFGPRYGLPPAISGHNSYFLWGPGACTGEVVIVLGRSAQDLGGLFASVERAATFACTDCMPYENGRPIWVARGIKLAMKDAWPRAKRFI